MSRRYGVTAINAQTALDTVGIIGDVSQMAQITEFAVYVAFSAGAAAGVVLIETADETTYTGTWAVLATITFAAASKMHYVAITGATRVVRARISSAITGGTVTVKAVLNGNPA